MRSLGADNHQLAGVHVVNTWQSLLTLSLCFCTCHSVFPKGYEDIGIQKEYISLSRHNKCLTKKASLEVLALGSKEYSVIRDMLAVLRSSLIRLQEFNSFTGQETGTLFSKALSCHSSSLMAFKRPLKMKKWEIKKPTFKPVVPVSISGIILNQQNFLLCQKTH